MRVVAYCVAARLRDAIRRTGLVAYAACTLDATLVLVSTRVASLQTASFRQLQRRKFRMDVEVYNLRCTPATYPLSVAAIMQRSALSILCAALPRPIAEMCALTAAPTGLLPHAESITVYSATVRIRLLQSSEGVKARRSIPAVYPSMR